MQNVKDNYIYKEAQEFQQGIRNEKRKNQQNETIFCKDKQKKLIGGLKERGVQNIFKKCMGRNKNR